MKVKLGSPHFFTIKNDFTYPISHFKLEIKGLNELLYVFLIWKQVRVIYFILESSFNDFSDPKLGLEPSKGRVERSYDFPIWTKNELSHSWLTITPELMN